MLEHISINTCPFSLIKVMRVDNISTTKLCELEQYIKLALLFSFSLSLSISLAAKKIAKVFLVKTGCKEGTFKSCNLRTVRFCHAKNLKTSCDVRFCNATSPPVLHYSNKTIVLKLPIPSRYFIPQMQSTKKLEPIKKTICSSSCNQATYPTGQPSRMEVDVVSIKHCFGPSYSDIFKYYCKSIKNKVV